MRTINISSLSQIPINLIKRRPPIPQMTQNLMLYSPPHKKSNKQITWNLNFKSLSTLINAGPSMKTWWDLKNTQNITQKRQLKDNPLTFFKMIKWLLTTVLDNLWLLRNYLIRIRGFAVDVKCISRQWRSFKYSKVHPYLWLTLKGSKGCSRNRIRRCIFLWKGWIWTIL
jgi:hypothetical protein